MWPFLAILILLSASPVWAAISFQTAASANASSVSITTPASSDLILVFSYNNAATTIPTLASGYTNINTQAPGGSASASRVAYKISDGTETTSSTWTNATNVVAQIYRGTLGVGAAIGGNTATAGNSAILTYGTVTMTTANGTSWIVGMGGSKGATLGMDGTMTVLASNRANTGITSIINGLDSNGGKTSYSAETLTVTGSGRWQTFTVELLASVVASSRTLLGVGN